MTLVVVGGYVLLLIPGIILSLVLIFSRFAYVKEGKKGLSALLRSRDLVKGNWWQVFGAFFIVSAIMLVGLIVGAIMIGFAIPLISSSVTIVEIVNVLILTFVGVAVQLATLHITLQLFEHLRSIGPSSVSQEEEVGRCKYKTLAWLSFIIFILAISLASLNDAREKSLENRLIEPTEISDSLAKERALELRTESITQLE